MPDVIDWLAPADPFARLATAMVAATVGLPAFVYGVFSLTWPIQRWLAVGRVGSVVVLLLGVFALLVAHALAKDVSRQAKPARRDDSTASESGTDAAENSMQVLKSRYAAGELDDDEFERKVAHLLEPDEGGTLGDADPDDRLVETE